MKQKLMFIVKQMHYYLIQTHSLLKDLDKIYHNNDSFVLLHKAYIDSYFVNRESNIVDWYYSIEIIQKIFDNNTFKMQMLEKINNAYLHDDSSRRRYKTDIIKAVRSMGSFFFEINSILINTGVVGITSQ